MANPNPLGTGVPSRRVTPMLITADSRPPSETPTAAISTASPPPRYGLTVLSPPGAGARRASTTTMSASITSRAASAASSTAKKPVSPGSAPVCQPCRWSVHPLTTAAVMSAAIATPRTPQHHTSARPLSGLPSRSLPPWASVTSWRLAMGDMIEQAVAASATAAKITATHLAAAGWPGGRAAISAAVAQAAAACRVRGHTALSSARAVLVLASYLLPLVTLTHHSTAMTTATAARARATRHPAVQFPYHPIQFGSMPARPAACQATVLTTSSAVTLTN